MKCLYHRGDFDGKCSAAIVAMWHLECELIGLDYQDEVDFDKLGIERGEHVVMVDFCLEPFSRMADLHRRAALVWIDHHASAIKQHGECPFLDIAGVREVGRAACELTYAYFAGVTIPWAVHLIGRYDVWDHRNPDVMAFQYGMRARGDWDPRDICAWVHLFEDPALVRELIEHGRDVLRYEDAESARYAREFAWRGRLVSPAGEDLQLHTLCMNRGLIGSKAFDSLGCQPDFVGTDLLAAYVQLPDGRLKVSLYVPEHAINAVDAGSVAEMFGGGGHAGAAGFVCDVLPFVRGWDDETEGGGSGGC